MVPELDLSARIGPTLLPNPVMTASGTAGHGTELARYLDLGRLGAVVVKSLSAEPWPGNPAPRLHPTPAGMINSIGLQGPGIPAWLDHALPDLLATGARVVASIWGTSPADYEKAASLLLGAPIQAIEINLSCPNHRDADHIFAQSSAATAEVVEAVTGVATGLPLWAKLTAAVTELAPIVDAATTAGATAVTLVNTLPGMVIDVDTRRPVLGAGGGGVSGPAMHPVAVRAVYDVRAAFPGLPIVGVGGVASGVDAVELMLAGADAVQVGTATFAHPGAPARVLDELTEWCRRHGVRAIGELVGAAHG